MAIVLTIGALEPAKFDATLEYIAPKGVDENGAIQFKIRAAVKQTPDVLIRANYSANADIVLDRRDKVLGLKEIALAIRQGRDLRRGRDRRRRLRAPQAQDRPVGRRHHRVVEGLTKDDKIKSGGCHQARAAGTGLVRVGRPTVLRKDPARSPRRAR
jgi:HlyD family secretion protein